MIYESREKPAIAGEQTKNKKGNVGCSDCGVTSDGSAYCDW